jgi:hypothetical protein
VGEVLAAADVNAWFVPLSAYKASDQSDSSGATSFHSDNDLLVTVAANALYDLRLFVIYSGGTQGSSDFQFAWQFPASTTMTWTWQGLNSSGAQTSSAFFDQTGGPAAGTNGAGNKRVIVATGTVDTSAASGTLVLRWRQNTNPAVATVVYAGSELVLTRTG